MEDQPRAALATLPLFRSGKVRDTYDMGENLLMVASDRVSAFDVVLPTPIPGKGRILSELSRFWFEKTRHIVPNHFVASGVPAVDGGAPEVDPDLSARSMVVRKAERIDIECVVRGYLAGSGWAEYSTHGTLAGIPLATGLRQAERLRRPVFPPAMKNDSGHDENISVDRLRQVVGSDLAADLERISVELYAFAADFARDRGIILADTKFEFGMVDGTLTLIDEALTPDSSRFWDAAGYQPGHDQPSFDKQPLRDWLLQSGWNREPPGPELPPEVVASTVRRYREAFRRLTGQTIDGEGEGS